MSVNAQELLAAAEKSFENANCEADFRGVMARSYYSIYQDGVSFHSGLSSPGSLNPESRGGLHENLHQQLKNPTVDPKSEDGRKSKRIGMIMAALHSKRVKADYFRDHQFSKNDPSDSIAEAKLAISILFTSTPNAPTATPTSAIEKHGGVAAAKPILTRIK